MLSHIHAVTECSLLRVSLSRIVSSLTINTYCSLRGRVFASTASWMVGHALVVTTPIASVWRAREIEIAGNRSRRIGRGEWTAEEFFSPIRPNTMLSRR